METSAFNDINVKDSFEILVQEIYNLNLQMVSQQLALLAPLLETLKKKLVRFISRYQKKIVL